MKTWTAHSDAAPQAVWALLARPEAWAEWAPHVRGAWGLGSPEVIEGSVGAARLLGVIPVPARITSKSFHSWTWRVGPATMAHRVIAADPGCVVAIDLCAPRGVESVLAATYGPVIQRMLRRLARMAT